MIQKIAKLRRDPARYFPLAIKVLQQQFCWIFKGSAFFMQGQMDIHPKSRWHKPTFNKQTGGFYPKEDHGAHRQICDLESWDTTRRDMLILLLRTLIEKEIAGDFAEIGVYKGLTAKLIHHYAPERRLHLFDTFEGFGTRHVVMEKAFSGRTISETDFSDTNLNLVKNQIAAINNNVSYYKGYFPDTIPNNLRTTQFAFVHIDADLYEPSLEALQFFYLKMSPGGLILVHDYNAWPGVRKAVDQFFANKLEIPIPMPDKSGSALILKQ